MAVANIACVKQEELSQDIAELQDEVKGIKLTQDAQIRAIKDEVGNNTKSQIAQSIQYVLRHDTEQPAATHMRSLTLGSQTQD